jgi:hypothetical protein
MKKILLSFMLLLAATAMSAQTIVKGDMTGEGDLTVADVTLLVDAIVTNAPKQIISGGGGDAYAVDNSLVVGKWSGGSTTFNLNADGTTNYTGASTYKFRPYQGTLMFYNAYGKAVKTIVLNVVAKGYLLAVDYATGTYTAYYDTSDGHEFVDLGLPSGTLWATCNIGANSPEDYGDYFAWGETETKSTYDWSTYKWCNGSYDTMTKYCTISSCGYNGFTDNTTELDLQDDAAYVNWGPYWRMPSKAQFDELINSNYTTTTWTTQNGVYGRLITSTKEGYMGNCVFLPAAGYRNDSSLNGAGPIGIYWSRTLGESYPGRAWGLYFLSSFIDARDDPRYYGHSVRPVRVSE